MKVSGFSFFRFLPQHETLRTIALMRFIALLCIILMVTLARVHLGIELEIPPLLCVLLLLIGFNIWTFWRTQQRPTVDNHTLFMQLLFDIVALSVLLYFSGGATNPFASFYLPALAVGAALLPIRHALLLAGLSGIGYSLMTIFYVPLHISDPDRAISYHLAGMWANFTVSATLITWFVARLSHTVRERDAQLAQARERHLENERFVALGIQAANAAHEIGTPLSTIAIIASELRHAAETMKGTAGNISAYHEEFTAIEAQIAICKTGLDRMSARAPETVTSVSASAWITQFIDGWLLRHPGVRIDFVPEANDVMINDTLALTQILTILLDNAVQAVSEDTGKIVLTLRDEAGSAIVNIQDNGVGISPAMLSSLGHKQVKSSSNGHGIGLLLAFATARQIGASISLAPNDAAGICATLTIPIA